MEGIVHIGYKQLEVQILSILMHTIPTIDHGGFTVGHFQFY